jgi:uncharacterized membrane protein YbhN (UPF0104 family)
MTRRQWAFARVLGGAVILAVLVWRVGAGPFVDGVRRVDVWSLAAAAAIAVVTTLCAAWRWRLVASGLGVGLPYGTAVAAYYRSQFLNSTLPGGVLGDVHRAVRHGRDVGDLGRALRAVWWERTAGQVVQVALSVVVLLVLPSPVRSSVPAVAATLLLGLAGVVWVGRSARREGSTRWARAVRAARADLRDGLVARRVWPGITVASAVVVAGHAATFLIAARSAGSTASPARILPLALLVLLAMAVPANIAGFGPREGAAAWAFGSAGLGADQGVAAAVAYGVLVVVASLPGAAVLATTWLRSPATSDRQSP